VQSSRSAPALAERGIEPSGVSAHLPGPVVPHPDNYIQHAQQRDVIDPCQSTERPEALHAMHAILHERVPKGSPEVVLGRIEGLLDHLVPYGKQLRALPSEQLVGASITEPRNLSNPVPQPFPWSTLPNEPLCIAVPQSDPRRSHVTKTLLDPIVGNNQELLSSPVPH